MKNFFINLIFLDFDSYISFNLIINLLKDKFKRLKLFLNYILIVDPN